MIVVGLASMADAGEPEALFPPSGWLASVHAPSLNRGRLFVAGVLGDLGYEVTDGWERLAEQLVGIDAAVLGDGPVALGLAAGPNAEAFPFALLSPPDFDRLVRGLGAEKTGSGAVLDAAGFGVALMPFGDDVAVVPLDYQQHMSRLPPAETPLPIDGADLGTALSAAGVAYLADRAATFGTKQQDAAGRMRKLPWRSSHSLQKLDAELGMNLALWRRLRRISGGVHVLATRGSAGDVRLRFVIQRSRMLDHAPVGTDSEAEVAASEVLSLRAVAMRAYFPDLLGLLSAYEQGRPDAIEATGYPLDGYGVYERRLQALSGLVTGCHATVLLPLAGGPVSANRVAVLDTPDADALIQAIGEVASAWNRVVNQSDSKSPLLFERRLFRRDGIRGVEFRADLVPAAGVDDTPEMRELLADYVGNNGWQTVSVAELADGRVLVTDAGWQAALEVVRTPSSSNKSVDTPGSPLRVRAPLATAHWRIDRYTAWLAAIKSVDTAGTTAFGRRNKQPSMARAPAVGFTLNADEEQIEIGSVVPVETLRAFGKYWRDK